MLRRTLLAPCPKPTCPPPPAPLSRPPRCGRPAAPPRLGPPRALLLFPPAAPAAHPEQPVGRAPRARVCTEGGVRIQDRAARPSRAAPRGPHGPLSRHLAGQSPACPFFLPRHPCLPGPVLPQPFAVCWSALVCALRPLSGRPLPEPRSRPDSAFTACEGLFTSGLSSWGSQEPRFLGA